MVGVGGLEEGKKIGGVWGLEEVKVREVSDEGLKG